MKLIEKLNDYEVYYDEDTKIKRFKSPEFNYLFNLENGQMATWGRTIKEDPDRAPAPNILDMEITTRCTGINGKVCPYCYKANLPNTGVNMSFETFKHIIDIYPKSLTQVALGADATLKCNPDIWKMMEYCREKGIVPNVTAVDIDDETADKLSELCGAVAISYHENKEVCYNSIKKLTDRGMKQVNMHLVIYDENYEECLSVIEDASIDKRLEKLNAIVMLSLKQKGRATTGYTPLPQEKFNTLCQLAKEKGVGIGFDSCSSLKAYRAFADTPEVQKSIIPCEASAESSYINVNGEYFPCSFCEGESSDWFPPDTVNKTLSNGATTLVCPVGEHLDWIKGLNVLECKTTQDFLDKIWNHPKTLSFKKALNKTECDNCEKCRHCPVFKV